MKKDLRISSVELATITEENHASVVYALIDVIDKPENKELLEEIDIEEDDIEHPQPTCYFFSRRAADAVMRMMHIRNGYDEAYQRYLLYWKCLRLRRTHSHTR